MMTQAFLQVAILALSLGQPQGASETGAIVIQVAQVSDLPGQTAFLDSPLWRDAPKWRIHLNRTPPLYEGDPVDDGARPVATMQVLRAPDNRAMVRIEWEDTTDDAVQEGRIYRDGGDSHIYKKHSGDVSTFADACCVMVPVARGPHTTYPALIMGEAVQPVQLMYWRAGRGFEALNAHGRSTVATVADGPPSEPPLQPALMGQAKRRATGWSVAMAVPELTPQTPISIAIWNGDRDHRDGIKFFSLWYEVE